jgi:O-antigen ligase
MNLINLFKNKGLLIAVFLMFLTPLFPTNIKPYVIVVFALMLIIDYYYNRKLEFNKKFFFVNAALYLLMILSMIYTQNMEYGFKKLETMSSLAVFPLLFSMLPSKQLTVIKNNKISLIYTYIIVIVIINLSFFIFHFGHYKETLITHYITVTRIAQEGYNIHPIYLSMHIAIALILSVFLLYKEKRLKNIILLLLLDVVLIFFMLLLLKKGPLIGLFIALTSFVILKKNRKVFSVFLIILVVSITLVLTNDKLNSKFSELIKIEALSQSDATSTNIRYSLYPYAIQAFNKSPIIGHGIGDYRDELILAYEGVPVLYNEKYNSHNQYLSIMISLGLLGLIIFLITIAYNFIWALKSKNHILIVLLIFYCIVMTSENILERENGVLYFSFFLCFFSALDTNRKDH